MKDFGTKLFMITVLTAFVFSPLMMNAAVIYDANNNTELTFDEIIDEEGYVEEDEEELIQTDNLDLLPQTGKTKVCYRWTVKRVNGVKKLMRTKIKCPNVTVRPTNTKTPIPSRKKAPVTSTTKKPIQSPTPTIRR